MSLVGLDVGAAPYLDSAACELVAGVSLVGLYVGAGLDVGAVVGVSLVVLELWFRPVEVAAQKESRRKQEDVDAERAPVDVDHVYVDGENSTSQVLMHFVQRRCLQRLMIHFV